MPDPRDIPLQYQQPPDQHHLKKHVINILIRFQT